MEDAIDTKVVGQMCHILLPDADQPHPLVSDTELARQCTSGRTRHRALESHLRDSCKQYRAKDDV